MSKANAGWYNDGSGRQRYWDGNAWTDHFADTYGAGPAQQYAATPQQFAPQQPLALPPQGANVDPNADPFTAPPRSDMYATGAPTKRKGLPGWGIALIIGSVVLTLGAVVAAIVLFVSWATEQSDDVFSGFEDFESYDPELEATWELEGVYWELTNAYYYDSCTELLGVTTQAYRDAAGIEGGTCEGAFTFDEYTADFYGYVESAMIDGDTATLRANEGSYVEDDAVPTIVDYTLVKVDGEWRFDSGEYSGK